jgi:restriction endonuclease
MLAVKFTVTKCSIFISNPFFFLYSLGEFSNCLTKESMKKDWGQNTRASVDLMIIRSIKIHFVRTKSYMCKKIIVPMLFFIWDLKYTVSVF